MPLAAADQDRAPLAVQVGQVQPQHFLAAQAGRVERLQDRPVAQAQGSGNVRLREDRFRFAGRERVPGQTLLVSRQLEMRRRIHLQIALAREPAEPAAQTDQPMRLAGEGQRLPIPLAVVVQVPLVALDHLASHLARLRHAPLVTPENELAHRQAENRDRGDRIVMGLQVEQVPLQPCGQALRIRGIAGDRFTEVGAHDQFSWTARRKASGVSARRGTPAPDAARAKEEQSEGGKVTGQADSACGTAGNRAGWPTPLGRPRFPAVR